MGRVTYGELAHLSGDGDALFNERLSDGFDLLPVNGGQLASPIVHGTFGAEIFSWGSEVVGINPWASCDDHPHRRGFILNNGVGGERGAEDHPADVPVRNPFCDFFDSCENGLK